MTRPSSFIQVDAVTNADRVLSLSCADVLRQAGPDIALFTPALLVTHGGFDRDPVMEFCARFPHEAENDKPFCIDLKPSTSELFFAGLGVKAIPGVGESVHWGKRLYGVPKTREEDCFAFLHGIMFSEKDRGFFASVFSYDMRVIDPTGWVGETLLVKVFGVVSNQFIALLADNPAGPPYAQYVPVTSPTAAMQFLQQRNIVSSFTAEDPLDMREQDE
jgi:hypothetical protein